MNVFCRTLSDAEILAYSTGCNSTTPNLPEVLNWKNLTMTTKGSNVQVLTLDSSYICQNTCMNFLLKIYIDS